MSENRICSYQQPFLKDFIVIHAFTAVFKGNIIYTIVIKALNLSTPPVSWITPVDCKGATLVISGQEALV